MQVRLKTMVGTRGFTTLLFLLSAGLHDLPFCSYYPQVYTTLPFSLSLKIIGPVDEDGADHPSLFVLSVADVVMSTTLATFNPYLVDS